MVHDNLLTITSLLAYHFTNRLIFRNSCMCLSKRENEMRPTALTAFACNARHLAKVCSSKALRGKGPLLSLEHVGPVTSRLLSLRLTDCAKVHAKTESDSFIQRYLPRNRQ